MDDGVDEVLLSGGSDERVCGLWASTTLLLDVDRHSTSDSWSVDVKILSTSPLSPSALLQSVSTWLQRRQSTTVSWTVGGR